MRYAAVQEILAGDHFTVIEQQRLGEKDIKYVSVLEKCDGWNTDLMLAEQTQETTTYLPETWFINSIFQVHWRCVWK